MTATFEGTVDILVKAYLNNSLAHGLCSACAVGNIVAHSMGTRPAVNRIYPVSKTPFHCYYFENGEKVLWSDLFITRKDGIQSLNESPSIAAELQVEATGYTISELARVEYAFETAPRNCDYEDHTNDEWMFNGLMAVVDVLADIHNIDLTTREESKKLFVKV